MSGSLRSIVRKDGSFCMEHIENLGDASEALDDCFDVIAILADGDLDALNEACRKAKTPVLTRLPELGKRCDRCDDDSH